MAKADARAAAARLRAYALALPGATEDFPWGERVAKVAKKVFVFLGRDGTPDLSLSVKLPLSREAVLALPFAQPTGYGLGKSGWVTLRFAAGERAPIDVIEGWILESYRAIAPKKLAIEAATAKAASGATAKPRRKPAATTRR